VDDNAFILPLLIALFCTAMLGCGLALGSMPAPVRGVGFIDKRNHPAAFAAVGTMWGVGALLATILTVWLWANPG